MRKFLWVLAVGALVLTVAAPAMAMDFKFGGQMRVRFYDYDGVGFDKSQTTNPGNGPSGADLRFRARFDASDDNGNVVGVLRLRIGNVVFGAGGGVINPANVAVLANDANSNTSGAGISGTAGQDHTGSSSGGAIGTRGVNAETEWAYLDFALPWNVPLRIRAGLQPWYEPKSMIIDDNLAGVRAYGTYGPASYEVDWWRPNAGWSRYGSQYIRNNPAGLGFASRQRDNSISDAYDIFEGKLNWALASWLNPGVYFTYGHNMVNCPPFDNQNGGFLTAASPAPPCYNNPSQDRARDNWFLGFTATGKVTSWLTYDFDFIWGRAKGGMTGNFVQPVAGQNYVGLAPGTPVAVLNQSNVFQPGIPITVQGFAMDGAVHVPIGPVTLTFAGSYGSGDKRDDPTKSKAFPGGYGPAWNGPGGGYEIIGAAGASGADMVTLTQSSLTNLWTVGLSADYRPVKALLLRLGWAYAGFVEKSGNCAEYIPGAPTLACYGPIYFGSGFVPNTAAPVMGTGTPVGIVGNFNPAGTLVNPGYFNSAGVNTAGAPLTQGLGGLAGKSSLGNEIHLRADYQIWTGFQIRAVAGWLIPSAGDTAQKYALQLVYDF